LSSSVSFRTLILARLYQFDGKVACFSLKGRPYFSPHPIPIITTKEGLLDFLKKQPTTYCVFNKKDIKDMESIDDTRLSFKVLEVCGNQYFCVIGYSQ